VAGEVVVSSSVGGVPTEVVGVGLPQWSTILQWLKDAKLNFLADKRDMTAARAFQISWLMRYEQRIEQRIA
jgi:hypothetical protein